MTIRISLGHCPIGMKISLGHFLFVFRIGKTLGFSDDGSSPSGDIVEQAMLNVKVSQPIGMKISLENDPYWCED